MPRLERVITSGTFSLDGQDFAVENNVWLVGDDHEVVVIDAAHDARAILAAVGQRQVRAVLCTHAHNDHVNAAGEIMDATGAPVLVHPADRMLWDVVHPDRVPAPLADGDRIDVAGLQLQVRHTPGHSPGGVVAYAPGLGTVFTGDTLFNGGPGATGRSFSDFPTILDSIRTRLLDLPPQTVVRTGHGPITSIGAESADWEVWVARGY